MLDDFSYGGHSGGHGGYGSNGKQTYVHEEHKEVHYDSDDYSDYSDHEHGGYHGHSGMKFKPSHHMSAHKMHSQGNGWGAGGHHRVQQVQVGACGRPIPPPVDYLYPGPPQYHSEWQQEEVNYYGRPSAWSGYRMEAPQIPARKVFVHPGHAVGGSVQRHSKPSWVEKKL